jgi:hypothetical protein
MISHHVADLQNLCRQKRLNEMPFFSIKFIIVLAQLRVARLMIMTWQEGRNLLLECVYSGSAQSTSTRSDSGWIPKRLESFARTTHHQ